MSLEKRIDALEKDQPSKIVVRWITGKVGESQEKLLDFPPSSPYEKVWVIGRGWKYRIRD